MTSCPHSLDFAADSRVTLMSDRPVSCFWGRWPWAFQGCRSLPTSSVLVVRRIVRAVHDVSKRPCSHGVAALGHVGAGGGNNSPLETPLATMGPTLSLCSRRGAPMLSPRAALSWGSPERSEPVEAQGLPQWGMHVGISHVC